MSISGNGTIIGSLDSPGLIWTSYNGYFNADVNYFSTATTLTGTNGAYRGTSSDLTSTSTATNGNIVAGARDSFSIQFLGYFFAPQSGTYTWSIASDDVSYLWIGSNAKTGYNTSNAIFFDNWNIQNSPVSIVLNAGVYYPIRIQYGDFGGPDSFSMYFTLPGSIIPIYNGAGYYFNDGTLLDNVSLNPSTAVTTFVSFTTRVIMLFNSYTAYTAFSNDGYNIYRFNSSQVFSYSSVQNVIIYYLLVGGGGAGGSDNGGGGGGGQVVYGSYTLPSTNGVTVNCSVTIGAGGAVFNSAPSDAINSGGTTTFVSNGTNIVTALGGGYGASYSYNGSATKYNSGGGSTNSSRLTAPTANGGYTGGNGTPVTGTWYGAGGGGGAGGIGASTSTANHNGGAGGIGVVCPTSVKGISTYLGTNIYWAGGGGGGGPVPNGFTSVGGVGGIGGGGAGGNGTTSYIPTNGYGNSDITGNPSSTSSINGGANTGGGGGGSTQTNGNYGGAGGSGIVLLAFPGFNYEIISYSYYIFNYTGADQTFTIPTLAKSVTIQCWGAGGASQGNNINYTTSNTGYGGGGGFTQATLNSIKAGQTFKVIVGQGGINTNNNVAAPATYGGGGGQDSHDWGSASGGGRSAVQILDNGNYYEIVTAGGGGGAGIYRGVATPSVYGYGSGGAGGGLIGGDAYDGTYGGKGGTQSSGGSGGYASYGTSGTNGLQYQGGGGLFGAGGGGGYYGGGGGGFNNPMMTGGGGGGSSFVNSSYATSQYILQGIADVVAGSSYLPSGVSNIGNGAPETNITNGGGASGKNGYVLITVVQ